MLASTAWYGQRLRLQESVILWQNVEDYPLDILKEYLSDHYLICPALTNAADLGWAVTRIRRIVIRPQKQGPHPSHATVQRGQLG